MAGKLRNALSFLIVICIAVVFYTPALAAQNPDFRLEMDSLNLQKGVSVTIVVSLINAQDAQIVSIDGLDDFDILSQSSSTSTTIVGNAVTHQADIYYTIMPKTTGHFTLKANINFDGKNYETNSLDVTVDESSDNGNGTNPDLFVETTLSHEEAYLGEKVIITYEVYSRVNIDSLGFTDYLTIDGVIAKELPDSLEYETVYIDDNKYIKYVVKQLIIDPIKTGVCTIPSFNLRVNVISEGNFGNFGNFGGLGGLGGLLQTTTPKYLQTEEAELLVKQLPSAGKPNNFSGIVGELNLNGYYSRNELNYGDSLALQVEMSGNCNLDGMNNLFSGALEGFTVYENQKSTIESTENNEYHAQKTLEAILIPEINGTIDIPPVSISYFNPVTVRYEIAEIPGTTINVLGDMPQSSISNSNQFSVSGYETMLINQVSYGDVSDRYYNVQIQKELVFAILIGISTIVILAVIFICLVLNRRRRNTALKSIYKRLLRYRDANDVYNSFNDMIKQCFGLSLKASSQSSIMSCLPDSAIASQVADIINYFESAEGQGDMDVIYLKKKIKSLYITRLRKVYNMQFQTVSLNKVRA